VIVSVILVMIPSPFDAVPSLPETWRGTWTGPAVAARLTTLHADPNGRVRYTHGLALRTFRLLYSPTGEVIEVALLRVGPWCYPRVVTCGAAAR